VHAEFNENLPTGSKVIMGYRQTDDLALSFLKESKLKINLESRASKQVGVEGK
jgi:hypothetical protein